MEKGKCYICGEANRIVVFLGCCLNANGICIQCFIRNFQQINQCPFCEHVIPDEIKSKIISLIKVNSPQKSIQKEVCRQEICHVCIQRKLCMTINCCWANEKSICGACSYIPRPHLLTDFKCPKCKYEYKDKQVIQNFRQKVLKEKPILLEQITPLTSFSCVLCKRKNLKIEGVNCCKKLSQICFKCYSKSLFIDKCLFCHKKFEKPLQDYLTQQFIDISVYENQNILNKDRLIYIDPSRQHLKKTFLKMEPLNNTNLQNKKKVCVLCNENKLNEPPWSCTMNSSHGYHDDCFRKNIFNKLFRSVFL